MKAKLVFIVDDDQDFLFQLQFHLENMGFEVRSASSQREAENVMKTFKPDLAIFDLMMEQDDSGFILSYKFKKLYPDVPVAIATAVAKETGISFSLISDIEKQWIKADLYLEKGIHPDKLKTEIFKILS